MVVALAGEERRAECEAGGGDWRSWNEFVGTVDDGFLDCNCDRDGVGEWLFRERGLLGVEIELD